MKTRLLSPGLMLAVCLGMILNYSCSNRSANLERIVQQHVDALDGTENLEKTETVRISGNSIRKDGKDAFVSHYKDDRLYHLSSDMVTQAVDSKGAWSMFRNEKPVRETKMMNDILVFFANAFSPLWQAEAKGYKLTYQGSVTEDGRKLLVLGVATPDAGRWKVYLDAEDYLEYKKEYLAPWDTNVVFLSTVSSDYQDFDGIKLATKTDDYAQGQWLSSSVINEVEFDVNLAESMFFMDTYVETDDTPADSSGLTILKDADPFKQAFNEAVGHVRIVALLSPT